MTHVATAPSRLFVAWRHPATGRYHTIGRLDVERTDAGRSYVFCYLKGALAEEGFTPLGAFPDLDSTYRSPQLFPFFANRVMAADRPDRTRYLDTLDLRDDADPVQVLAHDGGGRATDTLEVFAAPVHDVTTGRGRARFFSRGVQYVEGAPEAIARLTPGDPLLVVPDPGNVVSSLALQLHDRSDQQVGWVPHYLLGFVHDVRDRCGADDVSVTVVRVNLDAPTGTRLLCELSTCWPAGYEPFTEGEFLPLTST